MKRSSLPYRVDDIAELHRLFGLERPDHPLLSVISLKGRQCIAPQTSHVLQFNFYSVWIKENPTGILGYGHRFFDFEKGPMTFQAPGQVIAVQDHHFSDGWGLVFHPDFLNGFPLAKKIKEYAFFSYAVYEGLPLSQEEQATITTLFHDIAKECKAKRDRLGQEVIIAYIELFLAVINRIYQREFPVIGPASNDLLVRFEKVLQESFAATENGICTLPTVGEIASKLYLSPHYLSDTLKKLTGRTVQQYLQEHLLQRAKDLLATTTLPISDISFQLGFSYIQSFSKFFKSKTGASPQQFRHHYLKLLGSHLSKDDCSTKFLSIQEPIYQ